MKKRFSNSTEVYWGPEADSSTYPDPYSVEFNTFLGEQFSWYNFSATNEKKKSWFIDWVKVNRPEANIEAISEINEGAFTTAGVIARLLSRGLGESQYLTDKMNAWISKFTNTGNEIIALRKRNKELKKNSNIDYRLRDLLSSLETEIDIFMDSGYTSKFSMENWLQTNTPNPTQLSSIREKYTKLLEELTSEDSDLLEAYSHLNEQQLLAFVEFVMDIVSANVVRQKISKPRKKKQVTPEKQVAKMKFATSDDSLSLNSIKPKSIPGSKVLWVWNKKYRMLGAYYAQEGKEFVVKGTTILNFDVHSSVSKKIRKPEVTIPEFMSMSKAAMKKALVEVKSKEVKMNGRINSDTILLKVF